MVMFRYRVYASNIKIIYSKYWDTEVRRTTVRREEKPIDWTHAASTPHIVLFIVYTRPIEMPFQ